MNGGLAGRTPPAAMNPVLTLLSGVPNPAVVALSAFATIGAPPPPALDAPAAVARETPAVVAPAEIKSPFDRSFAIAGYGTSWAGSYAGAGVGGRIRIEPWTHFGIDLFGEALLVDTPHGLRHDHPIGFNLYVPLRLNEDWRFRPLLGMCVVASFIEAEKEGAPRADDVLVGAHAGAGVERAIGSRFSAFLEVQGSGWMGHDRAVQGWTGAVGNDLKPFAVAQAMLGLSAHLGSK